MSFYRETLKNCIAGARADKVRANLYRDMIKTIWTFRESVNKELLK